MRAKGEFDVDLQPLSPYSEGSRGISLGRLSIEKTFRGDLEGRSQGEMLSAISGKSDSAGYVAVEQFIGSLGGKTGSFVLQHFGITHEGEYRLVLEVVPGTGTDELAGISGKMAIEIEGGKHSYEFTYSL